MTAMVSIARWDLKEAGTTKRWLEEHEAHTRRSHRMRKQKSLKSKTDTECVGVYATGISVKVSVHYPGRSRSVSWEKSAEAVVAK